MAGAAFGPPHPVTEHTAAVRTARAARAATLDKTPRNAEGRRLHGVRISLNWFCNSTAMQFIAVKTTHICAKRGNIRSQCVTIREQCHDPDIGKSCVCCSLEMTRGLVRESL